MSGMFKNHLASERIQRMCRVWYVFRMYNELVEIDKIALYYSQPTMTYSRWHRVDLDAQGRWWHIVETGNLWSTLFGALSMVLFCWVKWARIDCEWLVNEILSSASVLLAFFLAFLRFSEKDWHDSILCIVQDKHRRLNMTFLVGKLVF